MGLWTLPILLPTQGLAQPWQTVGVSSIFFERMNVDNDGNGGNDEATSFGRPTGTMRSLIPLPGIQ